MAGGWYKVAIIAVGLPPLLSAFAFFSLAAWRVGAIASRTLAVYIWQHAFHSTETVLTASGDDERLTGLPPSRVLGMWPHQEVDSAGRLGLVLVMTDRTSRRPADRLTLAPTLMFCTLVEKAAVEHSE